MMNLKVVATNGTFEARCLPIDFIDFEEHFDKPVTALEQGRITHLYFLAFTALRRANKIDDVDFKVWAATVVSVEQADDDADAIPPLESNQPIG
jgi:hypothetical protein